MHTKIQVATHRLSSPSCISAHSCSVCRRCSINAEMEEQDRCDAGRAPGWPQGSGKAAIWPPAGLPPPHPQFPSVLQLALRHGEGRSPGLSTRILGQGRGRGSGSAASQHQLEVCFPGAPPLHRPALHLSPPGRSRKAPRTGGPCRVPGEVLTNEHEPK